MEEYEYWVEPFDVKTGPNDTPVLVASQLQEAINKHGPQGWEFCSVASVNLETRPGCLAGIFGASPGYTRYNQIIFRRPKK